MKKRYQGYLLIGIIIFTIIAVILATFVSKQQAYADDRKSVAEALRLCAERDIQYLKLLSHTDGKEYVINTADKLSDWQKLLSEIEVGDKLSDTSVPPGSLLFTCELTLEDNFNYQITFPCLSISDSGRSSKMYSIVNSDYIINKLNEYLPMKRESTNPVSEISPNGLYRAETYGENKGVTAAGKYPVEGIRLIDISNGKVLWNMDGYYDCTFLWSSDSRYLSVSYMARIYWETVIVNTGDFSEVAVPLPDQVRENLREYRPDVYQKGVKWLNDSQLDISLQWIGKDNKMYSGSYIFNPATKGITDVEMDEGIIPG